jgi:hypothetical protein
MLDTKPITNEDLYEEDYRNLVNEIEYRISQVVREEIQKAHEENSDGLKFLMGDLLDQAIHDYILNGRYKTTNFPTNNIELVLDKVDDQRSYR